MREAANGHDAAQLGPAMVLGQAFDDVLQGGAVERVVGLEAGLVGHGWGGWSTAEGLAAYSQRKPPPGSAPEVGAQHVAEQRPLLDGIVQRDVGVGVWVEPIAGHVAFGAVAVAGFEQGHGVGFHVQG
ncbi:MAG: hypothetical protein RLZZ494_320 [Pseudomonadota bacterium]